MISGINTTSDISKLLEVISRALRWVKFETILKYHFDDTFLYDFFGFSPETQKVVKYIKILKIRQTKKFKNE